MSGPTTRSPNLLPRVVAVESDRVPTSALDTDGTLVANSDVKIATQKAIKTYVDAHSSGADVVVGLANGTADGVVINADLAAAAPGRVRLRAGQTYVLERAIVIPDGCVLDIRGAHLIRKAGYSGSVDYLIVNGASLPLRSVSDAVLTGTALTTAVTSGATITTLAVSALSAALPSGALVTLINAAGTSFQSFALSSSAAAGATVLNVVSQVATATFAIGSQATSNILTSATAAFTGADVGRSVIVVGAGRTTTTFPAATDLATSIASVISATSVALTQAGCAAVAAATLKVYGRDGSIGLIADAASSIHNGSAVTSPNPHAIHFRHIDRLTAIGNGCLCTGGVGGGSVFISPGDITGRMMIDGWNFSTSMGGIQPMGPLNNYSITNIAGTTGDDLVAIQGSATGWDVYNINDVQGAVTNGYIGNIYPDQCGAAGVKVFGGFDNGGINCPIKGLTIECVRGSVGTYGITIQTDRSGVTDIDGLVIRDYRITSTAGHTATPIKLATSGGGTATIEHGEWDGSSGTSGARRQMVDLWPGSWSSLMVKDHKIIAGDYVDIVRNGGANTVLSIKDAHIRFSVGSAILTSTGTAAVLDMEGIFALTGGTGGGVVVASANAITEIRASKIHAGSSTATLASAFALQTAGQAPTTVLRLSQADFVGTITNVIDTLVPLGLYLDGVSFVNAGKAINVGAAVAVRVRSGHTTRWAMSGAALANTGGGSISADGNMPVDVTTLTPSDGDQAVNTNTLLIQCDAGPATYSTAAGGWASVFRAPVYTPVNPTTLASCVRWCEANAITGLADGDPCGSFVDASPTNDPFVASGTGRPTYKTNILNGLPVLRFNGSSNVMTAGAAANVKHVIVVAKYSAATFAGFNGLLSGSVSAADQLILASAGVGSTLFFNSALAAEAYYKDGVNLALTAMAGPMNAFAIMSLSTTGWANPITLMLGQDRGLVGRFWNGDVYAIGAFNAVLSKTQLAGILARLQALCATPALPV